jgi:hypothetical protein
LNQRSAVPRGGARPGAGRKPWKVEEYRAKMQRLLMETVAEDDAQAIVRAAVRDAKDGNPDARKWLGPYVFGNPPKEVQVTGEGGGPLGVEVVYRDETARRIE